VYKVILVVKVLQLNILIVKVLQLNIDSISRNLNKLMRLRYNILNS